MTSKPPQSVGALLSSFLERIEVLERRAPGSLPSAAVTGGAAGVAVSYSGEDANQEITLDEEYDGHGID